MVDYTAIGTEQSNASHTNEYTGVVQACDGLFGNWELVSFEPVFAEDWRGPVECTILYLYPDDTLGGFPISVFSSVTITVTGTMENFRDGGRFYIFVPELPGVEHFPT